MVGSGDGHTGERVGGGDPPRCCSSDRGADVGLAGQDLQAADPNDETVASIAARWGFSSPGRFATQYRSVYGRAPRGTRSGRLWSDRTTADPVENE
ncbi:Helix-turn-helix domain-containing protein [Rhodococcus pyridinivorans]|nr:MULTISPECIES: helix-turn-helix domain-containing protein [Rhodococcus]SED60604.1 Helix-turn-helix domain-containing protein [Rhodococcus pyridinivorans]